MNQGTYEELTEQGIDFQTLVQPPEEEEAAVPDTLNHHKSHASLYRSHNTLDSQRLSPSHERSYLTDGDDEGRRALLNPKVSALSGSSTFIARSMETIASTFTLNTIASDIKASKQ